jgi:hypothetical protein
MEKKILKGLSDEELKQEVKKGKQTNLYDAVFLGVLIGIAAYSSVKNGFGLLTFLPIVYLPIAVKNNKKTKELEKLLKERNL